MTDFIDFDSGINEYQTLFLVRRKPIMAPKSFFFVAFRDVQSAILKIIAANVNRFLLVD